MHNNIANKDIHV